MHFTNVQTSDIWVFVDVSIYNLHFVKYSCAVLILVAVWSPVGRHGFVCCGCCVI